jgi:hypothetical protein
MCGPWRGCEIKLAAVRQFALSLPEVEEAPHFNYGSFRVGGRILVTVPPEQTHIHVFVDETQREQALALYPQFIDKLLWGGKVVGLRVSLAQAKPTVVKALIQQAWEHKAPPKILKKFGPIFR